MKSLAGDPFPVHSHSLSYWGVWDLSAQVLLSTKAEGECVFLQCCHGDVTGDTKVTHRLTDNNNISALSAQAAASSCLAPRTWGQSTGRGHLPTNRLGTIRCVSLVLFRTIAFGPVNQTFSRGSFCFCRKPTTRASGLLPWTVCRTITLGI